MASRWNVWVWLSGGGCGWKLLVWLVGVFLIKLIYPYCTCICSFLQQHPYFFFHFVIIYIIYTNMGTPCRCHVDVSKGLLHSQL